jgi:hypothetical protein
MRIGEKTKIKKKLWPLSLKKKMTCGIFWGDFLKQNRACPLLCSLSTVGYSNDIKNFKMPTTVTNDPVPRKSKTFHRGKLLQQINIRCLDKLLYNFVYDKCFVG